MLRRWKKNGMTLLGIAIGVCAVVVIHTIGSGGTQAISVSMQSLGLNGILVSHEDKSVALTEQEIQILRRSGLVDYVMPVNILMTSYTANEINGGSAVLFGVEHGVNNIVSMRLQEGRSIMERDLSACAAVCVVDESMLRKLDANKSAIGQTIQITVNGTAQAFRIIGVTDSNAGMIQSMLGNFAPVLVYVPYTTLQKMTGAPLNQQVVVKARDHAVHTDMETYLDNLLQKFAPSSKAYCIESLAQQQDSLYGILDLITAILTVIGSISLLVACLNIMTTMTVAVQERTREIGIKKAIGAGNGSILMEFLAESVVLSAAGTLSGLIAGGLITGLAAGLSPDPIRCIMIGGITVLSGAVFGICPALRAALMKPIDALKFH
jgi:putative ABC transport system permease protein